MANMNEKPTSLMVSRSRQIIGLLSDMLLCDRQKDNVFFPIGAKFGKSFATQPLPQGKEKMMFAFNLDQAQEARARNVKY